MPGISDARSARPLQAQPPAHPIGAQPRGRARGTRQARRKELNRVATSLLTQPDPKPKPKSDPGFFHRVLSNLNVYGLGHHHDKGTGAPLATSHLGLSSASTAGVAGGLPARAARNVGLVLAEDPKTRVPALLKDTAESVISIPAGVVNFATSPKQGVKMIGSDYAHRYGALLKGDDKAFRDRLRKEGVAPEVFDLASLATGEGAIAGRGLQAAAKAGHLGERAARIATVRPALRVSGGEAVAQSTSNNFFRNVVRHGVDTARKDVQTRRAAAPEASALVREAEQAGQVTKMIPGTQGRAQRKAVAQVKGRQLAAMKAEQQTQVGASTKAVASLSKPERRAFKYAMQYGATTPGAARQVLPRLRDNVKLGRAALEDTTGKKIPVRQNELPDLDYLIEHADDAFTPRLAAVMQNERARGVVAAAQDPGIDLDQARYRRVAPLSQLLGIPKREGETAAAFVTRLETEGAKKGLVSPGYFPSEKRGEGVFSAFAVGGRQAVQGPKAYTGVLTSTGRESGALDVLPRGIAKNIKRKYNWNLVATNFDRHAYKWSHGKTIEQLKDEMERRGIDPKSVEFWNPKKFREEQAAAATLEEKDVEAGHVTPEAADVHGAAQLATNPAAFKDSPGWSLIPKGVHDEIMTDLRPSGAVGRSYDVAKGKVSRVLLGNPAWLQFQIGSNALLTGLTGTGPIDVVKAQVWWRKLPEEQKRAIEPYIGVQKWYDEQTHLGAAANNKMVNAYRAFKQTRFYQHPLSPRPANVLDQLFKADNAQNNFFRKAVFYNQVKRAAYKRMGEESGKIIAAQERISRILTLPPKEQMEAAVRDAHHIEQHAEAVNKFLGDYTTYTTKERRTLGRSVMFYGFLRYSVKFTLYTMPIEHPVVTSILAQIGRLERDEQQRIFGADVPPWELGNLYTRDGKRYQLSRLSPFFNAIQYGEPGSLTSSISPLAQAALNQVASRDVTLDKPYTVKGSGKYVEKGKELGHPLGALIPGTTRNRIATEQLLRLSPYYRIAEKTGFPGVAAPLRGKQTSESGLLWPDPVRYKQTTKQSRDAAARNEQTKAAQAAGGARRQLLEQLLPLAGQDGSETVRKAREFDAAERKKKQKKRKPKGSGKPDLLPGGGKTALPDLLGG